MRTECSKNARFAVFSAIYLVNVTTVLAQDGGVDYETIRPILADACYHCHGPDAAQRKSNLRLDQPASVLEERSGRTALIPGDRTNSELWKRITSKDAGYRMPPPHAKRQLTDRQIDQIGTWIDSGSPFSEHWSFVPPARPPLPQVDHAAWVSNPIDYFVLSRLEKRRVRPSSMARKETLLRRLTLSLTGLPPSPQQIKSFLRDQRPGAYERLVDRLLQSPAYGEQMARVWLDAARYADTDGYQNDRLRYMWVWRDWLLMALNQNQPFDEFTLNQLAGDMIPDASLHQQIATGFCRNHRINSEGGSIPAEWQVEYVVDRVDTLGTVWLGLTLGCARCHDHKYDPVSQKEYYQLYAYFNNVPEWGLGPNNGNSPPFIAVPESWPEISGADNKMIRPAPYELVTTQTSVVRPKPGGAKTVMVMAEMEPPRPTYLLQRGRYDAPDKTEILRASIPAGLNPDQQQAANRLELVRWLMSPGNPLVARVTVNRYWQYFFGAGLVRTSENFGTQGELPSHPQLLDWLATEFVRTGWDAKAMHRLILTSSTYRQASATSASQRQSDPENRWLSRGPRFRLPASTIRDQALAASGLMVRKLGGRPTRPYMPPGIWRAISNAKYKQDQGANLYRRSLYTYWRRTIPPPTMLTFNAAEREVCLVRKDRTTTPLQALTLLNNTTFVEAARHLAERMVRDGGADPGSRIRLGFQLVLTRSPTGSELQRLLTAHADFKASFESRPAAASEFLTVGESAHDASLDPIELAAMTLVANTILNLDESITLE